MTRKPSSQQNAPRLYRFYCKNRLANEIQGASHVTVAQHGDQLLALQQYKEEACASTLLAVDQQRTVLGWINSYWSLQAYSPYGYRSGFPGVLGFNGERPDWVTGNYLLGNGYRGFNPSKMRFYSPDSVSPFGEGGVNSYVYCLGDPVNHQDPDGHFAIGRAFRRVFTGLGSKILHMKYKYGPTPRVDVPKDYELIGFHGTSYKNKISLEKGIDSRYFKRQKFGKGFYFSQDYKEAAGYALESRSGPGDVFGVYAKGFKDFKKGQDFSYGGGRWQAMMIHEEAFDKVIVRSANGAALTRRDSYNEHKVEHKRIRTMGR